MKKKVFQIILWSVSLVLVIVLLGFVNNKRQSALCFQSKITFSGDPELQFIADDDIYELLQQKGIQIDSTNAMSLNLNAIELELMNHPAVQSADVYFNPQGILCMDIVKRTPIIRVIDSFGESYYMDDMGNYMPLIARYTARVPVATGAITDPYYKLDMNVKNIIANDSLAVVSQTDDLYKLAMAARRDTFIWAQLEQVVVHENGDLEMIPNLGPGSILLGSVDDLENKFNRLKMFYTNALPQVGWDSYTSLNLKYTNQIICTKKPI
jgi:cell division protein FtsQ